MPLIVTELARPRVVVVDDDEVVRGLLDRLLTPAGYTVEQFATAEPALERIRSEAPDLVLLDLNLPDVSGHHVLEAIRSDPATRLLPVVMITGMATSAEKLRAQAAGVTDFIPKPFSKAELLPRIRALVMLKQFADEHEHAERVILTLAKTIDARDPHTAGHSGRVAEYADQIAARLGMEGPARNELRRGALFHDLGKIVIPDAILRKPGKLTDEERSVVEEHPVVGHDLLSPMKTLRQVLPIGLPSPRTTRWIRIPRRHLWVRHPDGRPNRHRRRHLRRLDQHAVVPRGPEHPGGLRDLDRRRDERVVGPRGPQRPSGRH